MKLFETAQTKNAAIAQSVERILGKDEVASSNLASSSKKKHIHWDVLLFGIVWSDELATSSHARARFDREVKGLPGNQRFPGTRVASSNLASSSKKKHIRRDVLLQTVEEGSFLAPRIYEGGGRRPGGVRIFAKQIFGKARFSWTNGQTPSVAMAPGVARIHRATSPINVGGKGFFDTLRSTSVGMCFFGFEGFDELEASFYPASFRKKGLFSSNPHKPVL